LAFGFETLAFGVETLAFGFETLAFGVETLAFGFETLAFGPETDSVDCRLSHTLIYSKLGVAGWHSNAWVSFLRPVYRKEYVVTS